MREYRKPKLGKDGCARIAAPTPSIVRGPGPSPVETFPIETPPEFLLLSQFVCRVPYFDAALNALGAATIILNSG
jgi:hypothetical protein